jgi:hypothetical protein
MVDGALEVKDILESAGPSDPSRHRGRSPDAVT